MLLYCPALLSLIVTVNLWANDDDDDDADDNEDETTLAMVTQ